MHVGCADLIVLMTHDDLTCTFHTKFWIYWTKPEYGRGDLQLGRVLLCNLGHNIP